jgi:DNA-directed RNA polymerase III subunit RPC6
MASAVAPSPAPKEEAAVDANADVGPADALYNKCAERPAGQTFFQRDLSNMQVADTMAQLTTLLQDLCDRHLMKLMTFEGDPCWKLRSREDADKYVTHSPCRKGPQHPILRLDAVGSSAN